MRPPRYSSRMISRSTVIHLRFPFSFFLLPVFLFGLSEAAAPLDPLRTLLIFAVLHLMLYPASNGFNSYYDRDEGSIGGIEHPPPVSEDLLVWSLFLDIAAVTGAAFVSPWFALMVFVFGLLSKAYSWPAIRLKKRPVFSWLGIGVIQGGLMFVATACFAGARIPSLHTPTLWSGAASICLFYLAGYPLTQVYQHDEDRRRGDRTISMLAGVRGTFLLSGAVFLASACLVVWHFAVLKAGPMRAVLFLLTQAPLVLYFMYWAAQAFRDARRADFRHAMGMNLLSCVLANVFFVWNLV